MQTKHTSILRAINNTGPYTICSFPTHERYQQAFGLTGHEFVLLQTKNSKPWVHKYGPVPTNHFIVEGGAVPHDIQFDIVLSQSKHSQIQFATALSREFNIPLISLEHTWPPDTYNSKQLAALKKFSGDLNVFISRKSAEAWGYDPNDPTTIVVHHGIDTNLFSAGSYDSENPLVVANDYINRNYFLGFDIFKDLSKDIKFDVVGDTKGLSKPAENIDDLVKRYKSHWIFVNTSLRSPIPTSLLEAMSCGLCCVSTATCMIPEIIEHGVNGFLTNDIEEMRGLIKWAQKNKDEALKIGQKARETIIEKFNIKSHVENWKSVFNMVYGKGTSL